MAEYAAKQVARVAVETVCDVAGNCRDVYFLKEFFMENLKLWWNIPLTRAAMDQIRYQYRLWVKDYIWNLVKAQDCIPIKAAKPLFQCDFSAYSKELINYADNVINLPDWFLPDHIIGTIQSLAYQLVPSATGLKHVLIMGSIYVVGLWVRKIWNDWCKASDTITLDQMNFTFLKSIIMAVSSIGPKKQSLILKSHRTEFCLVDVMMAALGDIDATVYYLIRNVFRAVKSGLDFGWPDPKRKFSKHNKFLNVLLVAYGIDALRHATYEKQKGIYHRPVFLESTEQVIHRSNPPTIFLNTDTRVPTNPMIKIDYRPSRTTVGPPSSQQPGKEVEYLLRGIVTYDHERREVFKFHHFRAWKTRSGELKPENLVEKIETNDNSNPWNFKEPGGKTLYPVKNVVYFVLSPKHLLESAS